MTTETVDNKVKRIISNIRNLPTPPIVFHQIQKVINDPNVNAAQIASILAEDPAMSVKVLKLTNSAFYGLAKEIESVRQAVVIVGFEAIKNLILSASVLDMFKGKIDQEYQESFWRHSLSVAFCCRILSRHLKSRIMVDPDAAFSAGLLHDIGKIIISCFMPEEYRQFRSTREKDKISPDFEIEQQLFGYNHAEIGGCLGSQWKIPHKLTEAIACHHSAAIQTENEPLVYVVALANWISKNTFLNAVTEKHLIGELEPVVTDALGMSESDIELISERLREDYAHAETFMQLVGLK